MCELSFTIEYLHQTVVTAEVWTVEGYICVHCICWRWSQKSYRFQPNSYKGHVILCYCVWKPANNRWKDNCDNCAINQQTYLQRPLPLCIYDEWSYAWLTNQRVFIICPPAHMLICIHFLPTCLFAFISCPPAYLLSYPAHLPIWCCLLHTCPFSFTSCTPAH
jgi:hypothetical protein